MDAEIELARAQLGAGGRREPMALWTMVFSAPLVPQGVAAALVAGRPEVDIAAAAHRTPPKGGRRLVPAGPGAGRAAVRSAGALRPFAGLTAWVVGAAAVLVPGDGTRRRRAVDDFARRLAIALGADSAALSEALGAVALEDRREPLPPGPGTLLAGLATGPAHVLLLEAVSAPELRREDALDTIRLLGAPASGGPPRRTAARPGRMRDRQDVVGSVLSAQVLPPGVGSSFTFGGAILGARRTRIGAVEGTYRATPVGAGGTAKPDGTAKPGGTAGKATKIATGRVRA